MCDPNSVELKADTAKPATSADEFPSSDGSSDGTAGSDDLVHDHIPPPQRTIGLIQLAVIVFYSVSGGPFGCEQAVRAGGPFYAILGFAIFPFVWSIPEAFITAELGAAYPEASGSVAWVEEAFGPALGWLSGALNWVSGATDNAIYPVLFLDYLVQMIYEDDDQQNLHPFLRFAFLSCTCISLALINYRGLDIVGDMAIIVCFLAMSPFIIFCILGFPKVQLGRLLVTPSKDVDWNATDDDAGGGFLPYAAAGGVLWRPFLNNLFWNLNSFDSASCFAGEVHDPGKTFPRAMFVAVGLVGGCYLLPIMVALGAADTDQQDWTDGYLATVATDVVGEWLGAWVVFAAGISNLALFQAEMSSDSFQVMGMSERGYLPEIFSRRSRYGTPTYGILAGTAVILCMSVANLTSLIEMLNFNYSISLILEYSAFIKLRISKPDLPRPYRVPLSNAACIWFLIPPIAATIAIVLLASYSTHFYGIVSVAVACLIYRVRERPHHREHHVDHVEDYVPVETDVELS